MAYKTVAVIGASGSVGKPVVRALIAAGFKVTAITRQDSTATFPEGVEIRKVALDYMEGLIDALEDQDVVISTAPGSVAGEQSWWAECARIARVKRFIPAEFGHNTRPGKLTGRFKELLAEKTKTVDFLIEQAGYDSGHRMTWTGIATHLFLDWGLDHGVFGINLKDKTANIFDSGNEPVSVSTLAFVVQSVVAVLQREEETANQYYEVVEHTVTQNQLLKIFEEETGVQFAVTHTSTTELSRIAEEKLAKGDPSAFFEVLLAYNFADGAGHAVENGELANGTLGLRSGDLRETIREYIRSYSGPGVLDFGSDRLR